MGIKVPVRLVMGLVSLIFAHAAVGQSADSPSRELYSLRTFLQRHLGESRETRFSYAFTDLNRDGRNEVVVYVTGESWCGSGGCRMLVLTPSRDSFRVIARTTITRPPIRVLKTIHNGWYDIGVRVSGGGIQPGYEAILEFDGTKYPSNPSVPPARHSNGQAAGEAVIPVDTPELALYPQP